MSKLLRSPVLGIHALSDSDIATSAAANSSPSFVSQRNKRMRQSSEEQLNCFKDEIKNMLDEWKENQNSLLNKLIEEVAEIKKQNLEIKHTNEEIEKNLQFINQQYDDMLKKVDGLETERKKHLSKISELEFTIEDMQRYSKSSSIELRNVPMCSENETKSDLMNVVQNTCKVINVNIQKPDVRDVFRINGKSGKKTIIVDLNSVLIKNEIIQGIKLHKKQNPNTQLTAADLGFPDQQTPVYISEALTSKGRRLFFLARDLAKTKEYKFCWTSYGKVYLRKGTEGPRIEVKDESQIISLRNGI